MTDRPMWLKRIVIAEIVLLWAVLIWVMLFPPAGEATIWKLPPTYARLAIGAAALAWTIIGVVIWRFPNVRLYGFVLRIRRTPIWLAPFVFTLAIAAYLLISNWVGDVLLALALIAFAALVYLLDESAWSDASPRFLSISALVVIAIGVLLRLAFVWTEYVWTDEGYYLSAMTNMVQGGSISPIMMRLPANLRIFPLWGYAPALYGLWARVFGVGLIQGRTLSYIMGLLSLPAIYMTSKRWYDVPTALITTSAAALSILFMESAIARPDAVGLAAVGWVLLLHVIAFSQQRRVLHVIVGILSVLTLETHLVNLSLLLALGAYYLYDFARRLIQREDRWWNAPLWMYLAGALPMFALYIYIHVLTLPDPSRFLALTVSGGGASGGFLSTRLSGAAYRYSVFWQFAPIEAVLIAASMLAAAYRRTKSDVHWLILMVFVQVGYFLFGPVGEIHYDIYGLPIFIAGIGPMITHMPALKSALGQRLAYMGLAVLLIAPILHTMLAHRQERELRESRQIAPITQYIEGNVPVNATVMGPPMYYAYLTDYRSWINPFYGEARTGPILANTEPDAYWMDILLKTWPDAWIKDAMTVNFGNPQVFDSYAEARHFEEVVPQLWVASQSLTTDVRYLSGDPVDIRMVAYQPLPEHVKAGDTLTLNTIWVIQNKDRYQSIDLVVSGWSLDSYGEQVNISGWENWSFHEISMELPVSKDAAPITWTLLMNVRVLGYDNRMTLCEPSCLIDVGEITIEP